MTSSSSSSWKNKIALFLLSQNLSLFGSSVVAYAITWHITLETSSAKMMTISIICTFLPQIFISLLAGVWADKYNKKWIIILSDLFIASATFLLAFAFFNGYNSYTLIFTASIVRSIGSGIQGPAVDAMVPEFVPSSHLTKVSGINATIENILMLISPAVGGLLLGSFGIGAALMVDVVTALLAVFLLLFLKIQKRQKRGEEKSLLSDLKEGLTYIKTHSFVKNLLYFYSVFFFLVTPVAFLSNLMVERNFGNHVWVLTANELSGTFGSVLGGVIVIFWKGFSNKFHTIALSCAGFGVTIFIMGLAPNLLIYVIAMTISGIFMPLFSTAETVLLQEKVAPDMLGRVFSVVQIISSVTLPLGMLFFGPLGDLIPIEWIYCATGFCILLLGYFVRKQKE